jgi:hypothetical protein
MEAKYSSETSDDGIINLKMEIFRAAIVRNSIVTLKIT